MPEPPLGAAPIPPSTYEPGGHVVTQPKQPVSAEMALIEAVRTAFYRCQPLPVEVHDAVMAYEQEQSRHKRLCLCGEPARPNRVHAPEGCTEPQGRPEADTCRKCGAPNWPSRDNCVADYPHDFTLEVAG